MPRPRKLSSVKKDDAAESSDVIRSDASDETQSGFPESVAVDGVMAKKAAKRPHGGGDDATEKPKRTRKRAEDADGEKPKSAHALTFPNHPRSTRSTFPTHPECTRCMRRREREKEYASKSRADKRALKVTQTPAPPSDTAPSATS